MPAADVVGQGTGQPRAGGDPDRQPVKNRPRPRVLDLDQAQPGPAIFHDHHGSRGQVAQALELAGEQHARQADHVAERDHTVHRPHQVAEHRLAPVIGTPRSEITPQAGSIACRASGR